MTWEQIKLGDPECLHAELDDLLGPCNQVGCPYGIPVEWITGCVLRRYDDDVDYAPLLDLFDDPDLN